MVKIDWYGLFTDLRLLVVVCILAFAVIMTIGIGFIEGPGPVTAQNEWIHPHRLIKSNTESLELLAQHNAKIDEFLDFIINEYFTDEQRARYYKLLEEIK